ncbi:MAG: trigger factor [Gammaproteobacteria bacterium]
MQVSVESTSGLERRLTVAVEEDRIADAVQNRLKDMTRTVKMKGFRKGKVPLKVVQQQYGTQVRQEVIGDVLQSTFYEAVSQENLRPAGMPTFDTKEMAPGKGLEYTATFEVYPEVAIADLSKQSIEKPVCEIDDADVDNMIENIRKQNMAWEAAERAAEEGDQVNLDFKGSIDGEAFEGGEGKSMTVVIGQGRMITGFEDGLKGSKAGDDLTLDLSFPENYHAEHLAGKPVQFAIHVNTVEAPKLPEVDADFAKKLGVADGDLARMREEIRNNMQRELESKVKSRLKEGVMDKLLASHEIDVPAALIDNESRALVNQMMQNLASQGMAQKDLKLDPAMFREQAERRVKLGLIMSEIVKQHDLHVDPDKVKAMVESIAAPYEHPEEVVKWYYGDKRRLAEVESLVFEEQVVDWVMEQANVEEKTIDFNELMNPSAGD